MTDGSYASVRTAYEQYRRTTGPYFPCNNNDLYEAEYDIIDIVDEICANRPNLASKRDFWRTRYLFRSRKCIAIETVSVRQTLLSRCVQSQQQKPQSNTVFEVGAQESESNRVPYILFSLKSRQTYNAYVMIVR